MFLQEEYIRRHSLKNVPVINHVSTGSLLLRLDDLDPEKGRYILLTIKWDRQLQDILPGHYYVNYYYPLRDSYGLEYFKRIAKEEHKVTWDQYASFWYEWSKSQFNPVVGEFDVVLAAFEIFVYCFDGWFAKNASKSLHNLIYKITDESNDLNERFAAYQEALAVLNSEYPYMMNSFKYSILSKVRDYCEWLGRLIQFHNLAENG